MRWSLRAIPPLLPLLFAASGFAQTTQPAATTQAATTQADHVPTPAEISALIDQGQYRPALQALAQLMAPGSGVSYDLVPTLMLKAECQWQLHLSEAAQATLAGVRARKDKSATPEVKDEAAAMTVMIRKAPTGKYTPKSGDDKTPLDTFDRTNRKKVYAAIVKDESTAGEKTLKQAETSGSLLPILALAKDITDLQATERAAAGSATQMQTLADNIGTAAGKMINKTETQLGEEIARIAGAGGAGAGARTGARPRQRKTGLSPANEATLTTIQTEAGQIKTAIGQLRTDLAKSDLLAKELTEANRLGERATAVMNGQRDPGPGAKQGG